MESNGTVCGGCRYKVLLKVGVGENVTVVSDNLMVVLLFNPWNSG